MRQRTRETAALAALLALAGIAAGCLDDTPAEDGVVADGDDAERDESVAADEGDDEPLDLTPQEDADASDV